jgi:Tfp pilus assembly protein PilV
MNIKGFSIMEALVASMIFSIGVVGVFSTIASQKNPTSLSDKRVQAAFAAKRYLEGLRSKVDAETYATGNLSLGNHNDTSVAPYNITYQVTDAGNNARRVDLNIVW